MLVSLSANQDGRNICVVTAFMEILKIQCVVNDLIHVLHAEVPFTHLELEHKNDSADDDDGVNTTAHPRNDELQVDRSIMARQPLPEGWWPVPAKPRAGSA